MNEKLTQAVTRAARLAARADCKEGGHRNAQNALALLSWGLRLRQEHDGCGTLTLLHAEDGGAEAIICPVHGRFEAPEWKPKP